MIILRIVLFALLSFVPATAFAATAAPDFGARLVQSTICLVVVCAIAVGALRWLAPRWKTPRSGTSHLRVTESLALDGGTTLYTIRAGGRTLLIANGSSGARMLCELDELTEHVSRETSQGAT